MHRRTDHKKVSAQELAGPTAALERFRATFSFPAQQGLLVRDLLNHAVHVRADRGNSAAYFHFEGLKTLEAHVSEIAPGQATQTHRHSYEALFYVLAGRGSTVLWSEGGPKRRIDWQAGDLFSTPIHYWHRHINTDPLVGARYLEITNSLLMKSLDACSIEAAEPPEDPSGQGSTR